MRGFNAFIDLQIMEPVPTTGSIILSPLAELIASVTIFHDVYARWQCLQVEDRHTIRRISLADQFAREVINQDSSLATLMSNEMDIIGRSILKRQLFDVFERIFYRFFRTHYLQHIRFGERHLWLLRKRNAYHPLVLGMDIQRLLR